MRLTERQARELARRSAPALEAGQTTTRSKYRSVKVTDADGITHDSKKEERVWRGLLKAQRVEMQQAELQMRRGVTRAAALFGLARQVRFPLPGGTTYIADFVTVDLTTQKLSRVVDVKSAVTRKLPAYRIKVRQMQALYGLKVEEL